MMPSIEVSQSGQINVFEFGNIYRKQLEKDVGRKFTKNVSQVTGVETKSGATNWSTHTYSLEEREAFADWINGRLKDDPDCQDFLVSHLMVHFRSTPENEWTRKTSLEVFADRSSRAGPKFYIFIGSSF